MRKPVPPPSPRNHEEPSHEDRIKELETDSGRILGEVGKLTERVDKLDGGTQHGRKQHSSDSPRNNHGRSELPSYTEVSVHPDRIRATFRNQSGVTIVAVAIIGALVGWTAIHSCSSPSTKPPAATTP